KQNGQLTLVAAAYNAGPNALSNWLKNRKREDILEFIEEIPYDETRTYVKLIARNKLFYERISNRDDEQAFPQDFLN
ncbi:MAG: transglycosylase SLT domain-containing protein, partial [Pseudobdellovibrio sp.]